MLRRTLNLPQQPVRRDGQQAHKQPVHQKPTIKLNQWLTGFKGHNTQGIKKYVMNFFISEGLFDVAKQFSQQANIPMPSINQQEVRARYKIKESIQEGNIDDGLDQLEKLCKKKRKINQELKEKVDRQNLIQMKEIPRKSQEQQSMMQEGNDKSNVQVSKKIDKNKNMESQCNQEQQQNSQKQLKPEMKEDNSDSQQQKDSSKCIKVQQQPQKQMEMKSRKVSHSKSEDPSQQFYHGIWYHKQEKNPYDIFAEGQNQELLFDLKCLKVINLIRENKIKQSIEVAKKQLIPYTKVKVENKKDAIKCEDGKVQTNSKENGKKEKLKSQEYLQRIQRVMSLIAFLNQKDSPNYELTTPQYRMKVAGQLNNLLLGDECQGQTITALLKLCKWCEKRLQAHINFPKLNIAGNQVYAYTK